MSHQPVQMPASAPAAAVALASAGPSGGCCVLALVAGVAALMITYLVFSIQAAAGTNTAMVAKHLPKMALAFGIMSVPAFLGAIGSLCANRADVPMKDKLHLLFTSILGVSLLALAILTQKGTIKLNHLGYGCLGILGLNILFAGGKRVA